jgi:hypothetical protein
MSGALASHGDNVDVTLAGSSASHNNAVFVQGPVGNAGTGNIDPFLTDGGGGSQDITRSYNTEPAANCEFDTTRCPADDTHALLLSAVPEVEYDGEFYREFVLDINKAPGGSPYLAMSELKLFLASSGEVTGYDETTETWSSPTPLTATKVYDLDATDDVAVLMDYSLESGSGASDLTFFVAASEFSGLSGEDCSYGSTECETYLILWNKYGDYVEDGAPADKWTNNDGFEEWGTVLRPVVSVDKDATGTFDRTIDWEILKSVDPDAHHLFDGDSATSGYSITVTKNETVGNIAVTGLITIHNPTGGDGSSAAPIEDAIPADILSVDDVISQAGLADTPATVDCGVAYPHTLGAGETLVCTYTASPAETDDGLNTATVEIDPGTELTTGKSEYSATADVLFAENLIGFEEINVDDTNNGGDFGPVGSTTTHTYDLGFDCSSVTYVDGVASYEVPNTATIVETGASSNATVTVNCYLWDVSKTADGAYNDRYRWEITKTVDPESQSKFAGDTLSWTWSITWDSFLVGEENHAVTGVITVDNPAPMELTVDVADELTGGFAATVECNDAL